ncbi:hypothetical protein [Gilvimarinus sp. DA14]|uniref:hypothetical protein n=1 Tax=Gilvimarinus sp. DA14 TaxID=2956798 RepID=UPI0020B836BA|nr:hypothetical protein [Gilvimarinus sp. DA14]UTF60479.1 hypothetical protein NHM04_01405 [Gilvimarinus sp. DA14]
MQMFWKNRLMNQVMVLLAALLVSVSVQADDAEDLDRWLETTQEFMPMKDVFEAIGENSTIANQYSEEEFLALSVDKQDEVLDDMLKEQGVYDKMYKVLNEKDWDSAGEYVRTSARYGKAIAYQMREMLTASMPEEQRQMMQEMSGEIEANPADVKLVKDNWGKITTFMSKHIEQGNLPPATR